MENTLRLDKYLRIGYTILNGTNLGSQYFEHNPKSGFMWKPPYTQVGGHGGGIVVLVALLIGLLILAQGILGLAAPELFVRVIRFFTTPPVIYLGAVIRVLFGIVLIRAASVSRARWGLRILGFIIFIGGLLTPFFGVRLANWILSWWSAGGPGLVRIWAGVSFALGVFVIYAVLPKRRTA